MSRAGQGDSNGGRVSPATVFKTARFRPARAGALGRFLKLCTQNHPPACPVKWGTFSRATPESPVLMREAGRRSPALVHNRAFQAPPDSLDSRPRGCHLHGPREFARRVSKPAATAPRMAARPHSESTRALMQHLLHGCFRPRAPRLEARTRSGCERHRAAAGHAPAISTRPASSFIPVRLRSRSPKFETRP